MKTIIALFAVLLTTVTVTDLEHEPDTSEGRLAWCTPSHIARGCHNVFTAAGTYCCCKHTLTS